METSAKTAVSDAFRTFTLLAFGLCLWNLPMIQWMIGLLLINLYSACNPRLCAAECERHILGNRQETAEGRGGWSRGRRWNQVRAARKIWILESCNFIWFSGLGLEQMGMLPRAPAATNNSCVTPKIGIKASERKLRKKILDHIDGWRALKSDPAQLVTIYSDPKVTPQTAIGLVKFAC